MNTIAGTTGDDTLAGTVDVDLLLGGDGNDTLVGGGATDAAGDTLAGGAGDDLYLIANPLDLVVENAGEGWDEVRTDLAVLTLADQVEALTYTGSGAFAGTGNTLANVITGGAGADTLDGAAGNDTLIGGAGADTLVGGQGDDLFIVDDAGDMVVELSGEGTDTVRTDLATLTLGDNFENLTHTGSGIFTGTGNTLANVITGGAGVDTLAGLDGNDTLDGGLGDDTLTGGLGDDTFVVDSAGDVLVEQPGEGTDTVRSAVSWTLADDFEALTLTGTAVSGTGNAADNAITGNAGANLLSGLDGNDTLDGGAGADTLVGGLGDDTFVVDSAADVVVEAAGEGTDTVRSAVSWTLGANLERLVLTGSGSISGTGNDLDNVITGNGGNNTLDGGLGDDTLIGNAGNDTFIVDSLGDVVTEAANQGSDEVRTALAAWTLGANLERLVFTGTGSFDGTGNELANTLTGQGGNDTLSGLGGNDTLTGGAGADVLDGGLGTDTASYATSAAGVAVDLAAGTASGGDAAGDVLNGIENLTGGTGADTLTGDAGVNVLTGNAGADTLAGADGNDTLVGGAGADLLDGGSGTDLASYATSGAAVAVDLAAGTGSVGDAAGDVLTGIENLTGGNGADTLLGDGGANRIDGGNGNDTLQGRGGNDSLVGGGGTDTVVYLGAVRDYVATKSGTTWTIMAPAATGEGTDTLTGVEYAQFSDMLVHLDRNNAPVVPGGLTAATNEDAAALPVNLLAGVWDFENDALSVTGLTQTLGVPVSVAVSNGVLTLDPAQLGFLAAGQTTTLAFDFAVSDGIDATARSLTVTVEGRNDAPVPGNDTLTTLSGTPLRFDPSQLLSNDTDPEGDLLSLVSVSNAVNGTVYTDPLGRLVFAPRAGFTGAGSFTYTVADSHGATATGSAVVTIEEDPDAPSHPVSLRVEAQELPANNIGERHASAILADGRAVVVWSTGTAESSTSQLRGAILDGKGHPIASVTGPSQPTYKQYRPTVLALDDGGYVMAWETNTSGTGHGIFQARYDAGGSLVGSVQRVDPGVATIQASARLAGLADGGWIVTWSNAGVGGNGVAVAFQRYAADGSLVGSPQQANTSTTGLQDLSAVTGLSDGGWLIAWQGNDEIRMRRYAADGTALGGEQQVNVTSAETQWDPAVAMLRDGGWVVVWASALQDGSGWGVYGRVFDRDGTARTGEIEISQFAGRDQYDPAVIGLADGGFMVNWTSSGRTGDSEVVTGRYGVYARRFDADGGALGGEFRMSDDSGTYDNPYHHLSTLAARDDGGVLATWISPVTGSEDGVVRTFAPTASAPVVSATSATVLQGETLSASALMEASHIDGSAWATSGLQRIATYEFLDATAGDATGYLTFDGTRVEANRTLAVSVEDLHRVRWHAASGIGTDDVSVRASDGLNWSGWSSGTVRSVPARTPAPAMASAEQALVSGTLEAPSLAVLDDGRSIMVWSTGAATSSTGVIRGVMLDTSGSPIGGAGQSFQVPAETGSYKQYRPSVASLADGGYVVTWEANTETGNGLGVFQVRYDAAGNRVGSEERVPSTTAPTQQIATVAGLQDGGWLVSWSSVGQDGSGYGVYQQRYDADGHTVGGEQRVNTTTTNDQLQSRISSLEDGGWVVAWYGTSSTTLDNVYQQRYAANGTAVGGEQIVNTTTANDQRFPTVSSLRDGGWVVVWASAG